ncbi:hypothetical protein DIZ27_33195 [Streptomyces sp. NWU339]|nr:hypothetical protein DIZ27_33195 [Streptomyces sp. NWU339]
MLLRTGEPGALSLPWGFMIMGIVRKPAGRRVRRTLAVCAVAVVVGTLSAAPANATSSGKKGPSVSASTGASMPAGGTSTRTETEPQPGTPGTPEYPRISDGPYAGFQFCSVGAPVVRSGASATFAADVTPSAGDPSYPFPVYPDMNGEFEIALPGAEHEPFVRVTKRVENGRLFVHQNAVLPEGEYRWRVRAEHHGLHSPWTAWCDFVVRPTS